MPKKRESRFSKRDPKKGQKPKPAKICSRSRAKTSGDTSPWPGSPMRARFISVDMNRGQPNPSIPNRALLPETDHRGAVNFHAANNPNLSRFSGAEFSGGANDCGRI
jgi:hypothetical protein